jgi:hypothetical protein
VREVYHPGHMLEYAVVLVLLRRWGVRAGASLLLNLECAVFSCLPGLCSVKTATRGGARAGKKYTGEGACTGAGDWGSGVTCKYAEAAGGARSRAYGQLEPLRICEETRSD